MFHLAFVVSYVIISNTCRNGKILLTGNMYVILAEHILLEFILCFTANPRLCCWLLHVPFLVRNNLLNVWVPVLYLVPTVVSTVEFMVLTFLAFTFPSSVKAAKLTNRLQTKVMRLPSPSWFCSSQGCTKHSKVQARISNESWASQVLWQLFPLLPLGLQTAVDEGAVRTEHSSADHQQ